MGAPDFGQRAFLTIQGHCLKKPGATEDYPWEHHAWKIGGKAFCFGTAGSAGITVKATLDEQAVLTMLPHIEVSKYVGRYGWITVAPTDDETLGHALELIDRSYDLVRAKQGKKR